MRKVNIVLLVGIAAFAMTGMTVLFMNNLGRNAGRYGTFEHARNTGQAVNIQGKWVNRGNLVEDPNYIEFDLQDSTGTVSRVHYSDPMPANMVDAERITIEGKYHDDIFLAEKIYLKCPSKYEAKGVPDELK